MSSQAVTIRLLVALALIPVVPVRAAEGGAGERTGPETPGHLCEHFRQEPWPEGASDEGRERRAFLARQLERFCGGSDDSEGNPPPPTQR
jgi:hypothetical protein